MNRSPITQWQYGTQMHAGMGIPIFALVGIGVLILLSTNVYGRYLRIPRGKGSLVLLASFFASLALGYYRIHEFLGLGAEGENVAAVGLAYLLPLVGLPLLAKFYLTWIAGAASEAEKAPGMEGVRHWLRAANLFCVVAISLCLRFSFGYSFLTALALGLMALLAYPLCNLFGTSPVAPAPNTDTVAPERERVLQMLNDGKITAQDSAELLNALAHSVQPRAPQYAPTPHRKLVWIGLALLLIGFFLPWFVVTSGDLQQAMNNRLPRIQGTADFGAMMTQGAGFEVAGGDIGHGLGWFVLLLGIVAATLPFVAANLDSQTCQKTSLIALSIGAIILVYLFSQGFRSVSIGILLALGGYALEFIGVLKERKLDWGRTL